MAAMPCRFVVETHRFTFAFCKMLKLELKLSNLVMSETLLIMVHRSAGHLEGHGSPSARQYEALISRAI